MTKTKLIEKDAADTLAEWSGKTVKNFGIQIIDPLSEFRQAMFSSFTVKILGTGTMVWNKGELRCTWDVELVAGNPGKVSPETVYQISGPTYNLRKGTKLVPNLEVVNV